MSWLKKPLALALIVVALLASAPEEDRATGGEHSYYKYYFECHGYVYADAGRNYTT